MTERQLLLKKIRETMTYNTLLKNRKYGFLLLAFLSTWMIFIYGINNLGFRNVLKFRNSNDDLQVVVRYDSQTLNYEATNTEFGITIGSRQQHISNTCREHKDQDFLFKRHGSHSLSGRLFRNAQHGLLYCAIEKVGSSFWKRILKVLDQSNTSNFHVFDMPSMKAHVGISDSMGLRKESIDDIQSMFDSYTSFMFTRDPFARLFSGYVDKMILPNPVGQQYGFLIARRILKRQRNATHLSKSEFKEAADAMCSLNVTFADMSSFVADSILTNSRIEGHFSPVYEHCEPCTYNYTFIGKMETFMNDTKYILSSVGLKMSDVVGTENEGKTDEMNEKGIIEDLANRTFQFLRSKNLQCLEMKNVLTRLWRAYQIRGIISKDERLPHFPKPDLVRVKQFITAAWKVYDKSKTPREEKLKQRDEALQEAYSSLPRPILKRVAMAFARDCILFNYNCDVDTRFPPRTSGGFSYLQVDF